MATNISLVGNVVRITDGAAQPIDYVGVKGSYSFNSAGTILNLNLGGVASYSIPFDDLEVGGAAPADVDAAYTALSTVFPNPNGGAGGSTPTLDAVLAEGSTLTANRTVELNGKDLEIVDTATNKGMAISGEEGSMSLSITNLFINGETGVTGSASATDILTITNGIITAITPA